MSEALNSMIETNNSTPVRPLRGLEADAPEPIIASIKSEFFDLNASLPLKKRIPISTIEQIVERCQTSGISDFAVKRAVDNFVSTVLNPDIANPTSHVDLLPINHPLSSEKLSKYTVRGITASYFESDIRIEDEQVRAMVASAVQSEPTSAARKFYVEALSSTPNGLEYVGMVEHADVVVEQRRKF